MRYAPLLLQPHGFEGLRAIEEDANAADLPADEVIDVRRLSVEGNAAGPARGAWCTGGRDLRDGGFGPIVPGFRWP